ncbi:bifunctional acetaldehyde-CoA/alcohol dehydrogenase [Erysipelothrix rhusiopathiae]|uniref:bifunctional acetaldehyde-CoA/alcohol dehydrogenase n=1 Tax=Erysipelothrix rhusiopathiae TaxID=1648 RepID=UPI000E006F31|nr:bifunctional acetaldehyde-CoA/alcohol dehydrogenase [Erysipelothrix rhusiopathiae]MCG4436959.1 bifunctional acetaldehyde-CoA/alcohol dehydrogenase [Erysipelothrix rhusiopathiae]MDE8033491.1 bifunctional acetaldehyde-CoA/alcohol dehydrogenase [Erysipelothrix rhusiopathiae]MDE8038233.1 bifunctional acetaldehyde-CoA/alcohol dehydrogenase [Erysipelothrix rhusiopathiae]MDE8041056.1 bifunctional acetaldehyde-CoA/alcohol dehydrogenase [Erysipelothrix rhusiopathiae]MDE8042673.1 bifunctional acetald
MTTKKVELDNEVNELVANAQKALKGFMDLNQEQVDYIVAKASVAALDQHGVLAQLAVEETGRGCFEDKATKNLFACEHVINHMRHLKTVGVISDDEITGITEIADPVGVICGITPVTNPTSTAIFKSLISLKTRNPIIFSFHPSAQKCSIAAAKVVYEAAVAAGAPEHCVQWIERGSKEKTDELMNHDGVATILATGGNAMVRAAYSCGKPALGVGAGNVPAYIEKSADVAQAVNDIALSKSFDNGMICASEQAVIIDEDVYDEAIEKFKKYGMHFLSAVDKKKVEKFMFGVSSGDANVLEAKLNPNVVGKDATWIAEQAGIKVPSNTVILAAECKEVGPNEVLTREKLSPVLAVLKSKDSDEGISLARQMVEFDGLGHSAAIHTKSKELSEKFGETVPAIRIIWNSPSTFGGIGNIYNDFIPSLTLGCGSYGHNSVGDNVSAVHLLNIKKIGRRNNNMQWFKVPSKIYFERNSIQYLKSMRDVERVFVVTDRAMVDLGYYNLIVEQLNKRRNKVQIQLFCDVEPDPSLNTVKRGYEMMKSFQPDTIIALGGGSPMDAAKGMWIFYEHPDVDFNDLKQKFVDIRKRAFRYPDLGEKAQLVCIPTTSGTGSEVTPFAVITDTDANKKYPLADYSLVPTVAIVDPIFTTNLPASVTADTGLDVLTHATEAYVSNFANDYTDGLAIQAIKMVFENLERAVHNGKNDLDAREKMHNASTLAGMAFANAFLGMSHSLAHKIGGKFHEMPHGRINAILLPYVVRYNGTHPEKPSLWPKYNVYRAHERYAELARILGLPASTTEEGVESYAQACHDLAVRCGIKMSFQEQGVNEKAFMAETETIAYLAYEDQCSPCNPRLPLVKDMKAIIEHAYYPAGKIPTKSKK